MVIVLGETSVRGNFYCELHSAFLCATAVATARRKRLTMPSRRLPEFVIIGAPKSATTWLVTHLRAQADVFMPSPEIHFFNRNYARGLDWYAAHFAAAHPSQIVGEKSASYLADPEVPRRLRLTLTTAKLIVQLRNPVERAYSDYCMLLRRGEVRDDVERYLDTSNATMPRFLHDGLYARHLRAFLDLFPREQIKIILYDDVSRDPAAVFAQVASFVGVRDARFVNAPERRVKDRTAPMLPLAVRRVARPFKPLVAPWRSHRWFQKVHARLARPVRYPPLSNELRYRLLDYYTDDVATLEKLLERNLDRWLEPQPVHEQT